MYATVLNYRSFLPAMMLLLYTGLQTTQQLLTMPITLQLLKRIFPAAIIDLQIIIALQKSG